MPYRYGHRVAPEMIVLNLGYVALLGSTQMRTIPRIRVVLLIASAGFMSFAVLTGIWSMLIWNLVTVTLHVVSLGRHARRDRPIELTDDEERCRRETFPAASVADFRAAWSAGVERRLTNTVLTTRGAPARALSLITAGTIEIRDRGRVLAQLRPGSFVGEVSVLGDAPACADAVAIGDATIRQWSVDDLTALENTRPAAALVLRRAATADGFRKLVP